MALRRARRIVAIAPGDFFTVERAGESLIVTRDAGGTVHAFYNVCRHRGTRLCGEASGRFTGSIQCPYHAWTYALNGELKVARNMSEVPGFDRRAYPLKEAAVALWEGFIFVYSSFDKLRMTPDKLRRTDKLRMTPEVQIP